MEADGTAIFVQRFDESEPGPVDVTRLGALFDSPRWSNGVAEGRVSIVDGGDTRTGNSLRVEYPAGGIGPLAGGAQWRVEFDAPHSELFCSYRVRFAPGFDFVLGGKLPGLVGGKANSGGRPPTGYDGWSARMMWSEDGCAVQYVYHPDQSDVWGEDMPWDLGPAGQRSFEPGVWHLIEHRVAMNTPGEHDGVIEGWFDGVPAFRRDGLRFREVPDLAIDAFYFSTFFGGDEPEWAPRRDESVLFDDIVVSTSPIAH